MTGYDPGYNSGKHHAPYEPAGGLRELAAQATPGPWGVFDKTGIGHPGCDIDCIANVNMERDARLVALAPEMAARLEDADRVLTIAENLFQMIDRQAWRDSGGDDGQGHYEGDYRAEGVLDVLRTFRADLDALNHKAAQ